MLISKYQNIRIIGYPESSMTQEFYHHVSNEKILSVEIITPEELAKKSTQNLQGFSYMVSFTLDKHSRRKTISQLDNLDSAIYVHDTAVLPVPITDKNSVRKMIGPGSFVGPLNCIMLNSVIGKHCIIEGGIFIGHYVQIGNNVIIHPGTFLAGRASVGNNCEFNMKSSALPRVKICDDVLIGALSNVTKDITIPGKYVGSIVKRVGS